MRSHRRRAGILEIVVPRLDDADLRQPGAWNPVRQQVPEQNRQVFPRKKSAHPLRNQFRCIGRAQIVNAHPQQLPRTVTVHPRERFVDLNDFPIGGHDGDPFTGFAEQGPVPLLALPEPLLGLLLPFTLQSDLCEHFREVCYERQVLPHRLFRDDRYFLHRIDIFILIETVRLSLRPEEIQIRLFQEELSRSGISESQYRDMAAAAVIRNKVLEKFTAEVPASAESIRYRQILVRDQAEADDLRSQIEGGADFAALAAEKSLDTVTRSAGGEVGWVPRGILDEKTEEQLFGQELNAITTYSISAGTYVYQVLEEEPDRVLDEDQKSVLAQKKLTDWVAEKTAGLTVEEFVTTSEDNARYVIERAFPQA